MARKAGFSDLSSAIVDREDETPHFQTLLVTGRKPHDKA